MRDQLLELLKEIVTISYKVSTELPFSDSGQALYLKNPKRIYVDNPTTTTEQFIPVLNGVDVDTEVLTIRVYFCNDSKQLPNDYYTTIDNIRKLKSSIVGDYFKRNCTIGTDYENDLTITTIDFILTSIYKE